MSERSPTRKRTTIGANNPLDRLGDDPLGFIPGAPPGGGQTGPPAEPEATSQAEPEPVEVKQISVRIPADLYKRLKVSVARSGQSQRDYLTGIIRSHLNAGES